MQVNEDKELAVESSESPRHALDDSDPVAERLQSTVNYLERQMLELADEASSQGYRIWVTTDYGEFMFNRWGSGVDFEVRKKEPPERDAETAT